MQISMDKFRAKLVIGILYASSAKEAERMANTAVKALQKTKVGGQIVADFADRVINQLGNCLQFIEDAIQKNKIMAAKDTLQKIRNIAGAEVV